MFGHRFGFFNLGSVVAALLGGAVAACHAVFDFALSVWALAFPPHDPLAAVLVGQATAPRVLGLDQTRSFLGRLMARRDPSRSRAPDSMAFVGA